MKINLLLYLFIGLFVYLFILPAPQEAGPASTHFQIKEYQFGAGGSGASMSSQTYKAFGTAGEVEYGSPSSAHYGAGSGLTYTMTASVPAAPTFTNPSNYYNKLKLVINTSNNPTDTEYAVAVSNDNFVSNTTYVQSDGTLASTMIWENYNTGVNNWGGSNGTTLIGLLAGTTYTAKVSARQGIFTQSLFGPTAQAATLHATLSFTLSPNSIALGQLPPATVVSAGTPVTVTVDTNAANGATIYVNDANTGLLSSTTNSTIAAVSSDLSLAGTTEGYGLQGLTVSQSGATGPMEILSPYTGSGGTVGLINTSKKGIFDSSNQPVTSGQATFTIKAKASNLTKAASDYADIITVIASAMF